MAATGYTSGDPQKVDISGDTMTGALNLSAGGVDVDVQEALSTVLSTGIIRGGEMNIASNNTVAISGAVGYIVDTITNPAAPTVTRVASNNQTVALTGGSLTRTITWWLMASDGTIIQQADRPSDSQRRTSLLMGATSYDTVSGTLVQCQTLPDIAMNPLNQFGDLVNGLGPFRVSGLRVSANGANLSLGHTAGLVFARAFNHYNGPVLTRDPHIISDPAESLISFRRILRAPGASTPPLVTTLDPANYDNAGVLTAVGGGAGSATIQRVWLIPTSDTAPDYVVQYGQSVYSSLSAAAAAIGSGTFVPHPVTDDAVLIAYVCLVRTATALNDPAQATIVHPGRFPTP